MTSTIPTFPNDRCGNKSKPLLGDDFYIPFAHLTQYLPYKLKMIFDGKGGRILEVTGFRLAGTSEKLSEIVFFNSVSETLNIGYFKPILRPISEFGDSDDLRKIHEFIGLGKWCEAYDLYFDAWFNDASNIDKLVLQCPNDIFQYFLANHYDVFGLIKKDFAISIHDVEEVIA